MRNIITIILEAYGLVVRVLALPHRCSWFASRANSVEPGQTLSIEKLVLGLPIWGNRRLERSAGHICIFEAPKSSVVVALTCFAPKCHQTLEMG